MRRLIDLAAAYTFVQGMSALAIIDRWLYGAWDGKGGDKFTQLSNILSIVAGVFLLYRSRWLRLMRPVHYLPFVIVALLIVSTAWSVDQAGTLRRAVNYAALVVCALGMAHTMTPMRIMKVTVWVCAICAVASLCLRATPYGLVYNPDVGVSDFIGIFGAKNMLGEAMVPGVLAAVYCFIAEPRGRTKSALLLLLFLGVIVVAKSATSLLVSLSTILVVLVMTLHARGGTARTLGHCVIVVGVLVGGVILVAPDVLFQALGKDPTLTGRTDIWALVWTPILAKPVLGWGFNAFWLFANPAAMQISATLGWFVPEAHNGLLELLLQFGVIGTGLFLAQIIHYLRLGYRCLRYGNVYMGRVTIAFIVGMLIMSVSEAILLSPSQIPTLQFFLFGFMCEVSLVAARRQKAMAETDNPNLRVRRMTPYAMA